MKKGQVLEGIVERVAFPNKGIVSVEGEEQKVIVKNAIEGQKIRFSINKKRKGKAEGRLLEVIEKSPLQTEEECAYFGKCGGGHRPVRAAGTRGGRGGGVHHVRRAGESICLSGERTV